MKQFTVKNFSIFGIIVIGFIFFQNCAAKKTDPPYTVQLTGWDLAKSEQTPTNSLTSLYNNPTKLSVGTLAWEDGIYISRDGLTLFAQYSQMDLYKATVEDAQANPNLYTYKRGPSLGQDLNPPVGLGLTNDWMHSDLAFSTRTSADGDFPAWTLSNVKKGLFNDAAPQGILNASNSSQFDIFVYTDDDNAPSYAPKIRILRNVPRNPTGPGSFLISTAVSAATLYDENPHIERYDSNDPNKLVLFFDSKSRSSSLDIFYSTSTDGGTTWSAIQAVSTVNSTATEHQPHLYFDGSFWWLYLSAYNSDDSKMGIFRYKQGTPGNWNTWQNKELVISAGTSVGVGEPSLTSSGDIAFVVITQNTQNPTATDKYDADPWIMKKK